MWINTSTQDVYRLHSDFRCAFPATSFPKNLTDEIMASFGVAPVDAAPRPTHDHTKNVTEGTPVLVNGAWTQVWDITDATAEEIAERTERAANSVRRERDNLLADTDWRVIKAQETSTPMSQAWVDYRQALRDITDHANFPWLDDADWPTKPE